VFVKALCILKKDDFVDLYSKIGTLSIGELGDASHKSPTPLVSIFICVTLCFCTYFNSVYQASSDMNSQAQEFELLDLSQAPNTSSSQEEHGLVTPPLITRDVLDSGELQLSQYGVYGSVIEIM
jgi:hypothetical protein